MNFKESLDVYRREEECFKKCENGCIADCEIEKCKYFSTEEELKEAQKCAVRALQYCVNNEIEYITKEEAEKAVETLEKYCKQNIRDRKTVLFYNNSICSIKNFLI